MASPRCWRGRAARSRGTEFDRCEREVDADAGEVVNEIRRRTQESIHGMRAVLQSIAAIDGPKSVIVDLGRPGVRRPRRRERRPGGSRGRLACLDRRAAARRAAVRRRRKRTVPTTPREDREVQSRASSMLAGAARGQLYRINTSRRIRVRSDLARARRLLPAGRRVASGRSQRQAPSDRRQEHAPRRNDSHPAQLSDVGVREGHHSGGCGGARDSIAAADQRSAAQSVDVDLQAARHRQGARAGGRRSRAARQPAARIHGGPGDREQAGPRRCPAGRVETAVGETGRCRHRAVQRDADGGSRANIAVVLSMADSEGRVGSVSRPVTAFQLDGPAARDRRLCWSARSKARKTLRSNPRSNRRCRAPWRR